MATLHVSVYHCTQCGGPVAAISIGHPAPANAQHLGPQLAPAGNAICVVCGNVQDNIVGVPVQFEPREWEE